MQDITMFFDESKFPTKAWPQSFENYYDTNPYRLYEHSPPRWTLRNPRAPTVESKRYPMKAFFGSSQGRRDAHFYGRMHAIPPQAGIPGFQRVTFLMFYPYSGEYDSSSTWAYEGCVLPGNRVIVGRWWWIRNNNIEDDDIPSGPFIFWNVDESNAERPIEKEDAMEFLDHLRGFEMGI
jgi:hypothetical protein